MPRYYFNLYNSIESLDEQGRVLADLETARGEAIRSARALAAAEITESGQLRLSDRIEIVNENAVVATVAFSDAITVHA